MVATSAGFRPTAIAASSMISRISGTAR